MRRTSGAFCSAQRPVIPKVALTPAALRVSRICAAKPVSDPASKVRNTVRRAGAPRATTTALPVTVRGRTREPAGGGVREAGTAVGVEAVVEGRLVGGRLGGGGGCLPAGEQAGTTDAASQSTNTIRARIVMPGSLSQPCLPPRLFLGALPTWGDLPGGGRQLGKAPNP